MEVLLVYGDGEYSLIIKELVEYAVELVRKGGEEVVLKESYLPGLDAALLLAGESSVAIKSPPSLAELVDFLYAAARAPRAPPALLTQPAPDSAASL